MYEGPAGTYEAPVPTEITHLPDDLRIVLEHDPEAKADWDGLTDAQRRDWLHYLAEGREPARRAIRVANLLMAIAP